MKLRMGNFIKFLLIYMMVIEIFISVFHMTRNIRFIVDLAAITIILFGGKKLSRALADKKFRGYYVYFFAYMIYVVLMAILRFVPLGQILWAIRNNFLYIFFAIIAVYSLSVRDVERLMKTVIKLQILNVIMGIYEYFVLHVSNDYLGGMFGIEQGCNANLNAYMVIISTYIICKYLNKKSDLKSVLLIVSSCALMAALSELKMFYIELVLIVVFAAFLNKNLFKSFWVLIGGIVGIFLGIRVLMLVNPGSMGYLNSISNMIAYNMRTDYGGNDIRISRIGSITQINRVFFGDNKFYRLFGLGLGACEDSVSFSWCNSDFATHYRDWGYRNLTIAMNYLESGYIGLIAFIMIFVLMFILATKLKKKMVNNQEVAVFSQVVCVLTVINFWYCNSIRLNIAYLTYFSLVLVIIYYKNEQQIMWEKFNIMEGK